MALASTVRREVEGSVSRALAASPRVALAVSGGADSMVLLHAAARVRSRGLLVAAFDHGTGPAASAAAAHVARSAAVLGLACVIGRGTRRTSGESEWREARWRFLREVASATGDAVATAHTRDDQIETVFMRALRHAGPRGLAGLYARSDVLRPLLEVSRATVHRYARDHGIAFVEDPSNASRAHLRNRVRHDLLPAICAIRPEFGRDLLAIARRSAQWRERVETLADSVDHLHGVDGSLCIARRSLAGYDPASLRVLWPTLAARVGVAMDWRGTHRAAEFTIKGSAGRSIQLSGGIEVVMTTDHLLVRRWRP